MLSLSNSGQVEQMVKEEYFKFLLERREKRAQFLSVKAWCDSARIIVSNEEPYCAMHDFSAVQLLIHSSWYPTAAENCTSLHK